MRVIGNYIGGGFGSKAGVSMEALAVAMARKVPGRPVKVRLTRMIATAPAIVNAISDVLGIRFNDLPLTAEKIFLALEEQKGKQT
jgi:CO/xanthine dehydrogenase Mo-binding subunit